MTVALIFLLVLLVLALLIVPFGRDMAKDRLELQHVILEKKFEVLIEHINQGLFYGKAHVKNFPDDPRSLNIFADDHPNRIVHFMYSTGHLTIEMGYKYYQKELRFNKCYHNLRNITLFEQKNIARDFIETAQYKITQHEGSVNSSTVSNIDSSVVPMSGVDEMKDPTKLIDDFYSDLSKEQRMSLVNHLVVIDNCTRNNLKQSYQIPVIQQAMITMNVRPEECEVLLNSKGEKFIYQCLADIPGIHMDLHILNCTVVMLQLAEDLTEATLRKDKFHYGLGMMGISPEEAMNRADKVIAIGKMFGI